MRDAPKLGVCRGSAACIQLDDAQCPARGILDEPHRMSRGGCAGLLDVSEGAFAVTTPCRRDRLPCVGVRCQLELPGVFGQPSGFLCGGQPTHPLARQHLGEGKPAAGDGEATDRSDRACARDDSPVEPKRRLVVAGVEACPAGREQQIGIVELFGRGLDRFSECSQRCCGLAGGLMSEPDQERDEEPVSRIDVDVE